MRLRVLVPSTLSRVGPAALSGVCLLISVAASGQGSVKTEVKQQSTSVKLKLERDEKALEAACEGKWEDACVQPLAEAGNTAAQLLFGSHLSGKKDYDGAILWLERAENQGEVTAMGMLGLLYSGPSFKHVDAKKALFWYRHAADLGNTEAMQELGGIYRIGVLTSQDFLEARRWFLKSAEAGNKESVSSLGSMAKDGEGADPDMIDAYRWFAIGCAAYGETLGRGNIDCLKRDEVASQLTPADILRARRFGRRTWGLFCAQIITFAAGVVLLVFAFAAAYHAKLF